MGHPAVPSTEPSIETVYNDSEIYLVNSPVSCLSDAHDADQTMDFHLGRDFIVDLGSKPFSPFPLKIWPDQREREENMSGST